MTVNVDVKQPGIVSKVVSLAEQYGVASRLIFTGDLGPEDMAAFPDHPDAVWNITPDDSAATISDAKAAGHTHVNLDFAEVDEALMECSQALNLLVSAWTADAEADIRRLLHLGVRNITTNRPLLAIGLRAALEQGQ
jgi:glycerophosphoryl diester phosphodiesterase